jgi:hypothetical protein
MAAVLYLVAQRPSFPRGRDLSLRDFWLSTIRTYAVGRAYLVAEHFGRLLPDVDEVEILALGGEVPDGTPDSFRPDLSPRRGTVNRHTLHGAEAESLAALWRSIYFDRRFGALCHDPFYALRFRYHGKPILETSICWKCRNVILPDSFLGGEYECGFDATSANGQKLLSTLSQYAPHPQTPNE